MYDDEDLGQHIRAVADILLGKWSSRTTTERRYGKHGSLSVDLVKGVWHDHERNEGGGVLDLVARETGRRGQAAVEWMREQGIMDDDVQPPERQPSPHRRPNGQDRSGKRPEPECFYEYRNPDGDLVYRVARFPKDTSPRFRQERYLGNDKWSGFRKGCMDGVQRWPYRIDEVLAEQGTVCIVEGEKDADNLWKLGVPATCNPGGAGKWLPEFSELFTGRDIVLISDNDESGRKHVAAVAESFMALGSNTPRILELDGLPEKGDVSDWIAGQPGQESRLGEIIAGAPTVTPEMLERLAAGRGELEPLHYIEHDDLWHDLPPRRFILDPWIPDGCVSSLYGSGGAGKSFLALMIAMCLAAGRDWMGIAVDRVSVLCVMCEDDEDEVKRRRNKIAKALNISREELGDRLQIAPRYGDPNALMEFPPGVAPVRTELMDRIVADARRFGSKLVVLDNIAQMYFGDEILRAQVTAFLNGCAGMARAFGGGVLVLGHPPKLQGVRYSGSTAWDACVRSRMWFERLKEQGPSGQDRYVLDLQKSNYTKRHAVKMQEGRYGVVEFLEDVDDPDALYEAEQDLKASGRKSGANKALILLRQLVEIHRRPVTLDELVKASIEHGLLRETGDDDAAWRGRRQTVLRWMDKLGKAVERREGDTFLHRQTEIYPR